MKGKKLLNDTEIQFVKDNVVETYYDDLADIFNKEFNRNLTGEQLRTYCKRNGLKNGLKSVCKNKLFTDEHVQYAKESLQGNSFAEFTITFNKEFNSNFTVNQINAFCKRHKISCGRDTRFKKDERHGIQLKKGTAIGKATWFKKGNKPHNQKPIGAEYLAQGYTRIKIGEPNVWDFKHRVIWEKAYGPIPENHIVIFLDKDKANFALNNLKLISIAEAAVLNNQGLRCEDKDLTLMGLSVAKLKIKLADLGRRKKGE